MRAESRPAGLALVLRPWLLPSPDVWPARGGAKVWAGEEPRSGHETRPQVLGRGYVGSTNYVTHAESVQD